tara:strand:+ start:283 stop:1521 length:1239 start_codon:yes stop_codon:yes gene_type:complete
MKKIIKKKNCRACKSYNLKKILKYNDSPIGDDYRMYAYNHEKYPIEVYLCKSCGLTQLLHVISPKILYSNYIYKTQDSPGLTEHFIDFASKVSKKLNLKKRSKILDIGSNDGVLLKEFKKRKNVVCGVEPAKEISDLANKNNINTYNDFLNRKLSNKIIKNEGQFDLIISNNVFANVDDINEWIANIKGMLKKDGTYIFETYYLYKLMKNKVFDFIYHEHLSSFSIKPLKKLFSRHNLALYNVDLINTKGGSIRCYVAHKNQKKISNVVNSLIKKEIKYGLYSENKFKEFQKEIDNLANKTHNYFLNLKLKKNNLVIGYGASISCTTLLYHFNIKKFIDILVDDNKVKLNRFLPGSELKVYKSREISKPKIKYVIILAWRFSDMILKKIKKLKRKNKIKVIIPCPKFKIITL